MLSKIGLLPVFRMLLVVVTGLVLISTLIFEKWELVKVPVMNPRFADLRMITATADCIQNGEWTIYSTTCDVFGRPYNYPIIWARIFATVGLTEKYTDIVGVGLAIFITAVFVSLVAMVAIRNCSFFQLSVSCMTVISPPVFLLIERGNTDSLIIGLIVASAFFYEKRPLLSALISSVAVGLKIFPALVGLTFLEHSKKIRSLSLYVFASAVMLWPTIKFLDLITQRTGQNRNYSFGATSTLSFFFPHALNTKGLHILPINIAITFTLSIIAFVILKEQLCNSVKQFAEKSFESALFGFAGLAFVGTYFSGTRFDYSLSVLVPLAASISLSRRRNLLLVCLQILVLIAMWLSFQFGIDNIMADIAASFVAIVFIALCFAKVKLKRTMINGGECFSIKNNEPTNKIDAKWSPR